MSDIFNQPEPLTPQYIDAYHTASRTWHDIRTDDDVFREACNYEEEYVLERLVTAYPHLNRGDLLWIGAMASGTEIDQLKG